MESDMAGSSNTQMTVAVIGAGEMGSAVGRRLRQMGVRVITELAGRSEQSARRAAEAGLEVINDDDLLVDQADFVLSIVPPGVACAVAERFRQPLSNATRKPLLVDCNAIAPATMRRIEALLAASGCIVVDAGIIGGPPPVDVNERSPRFYASGHHAQKFATLTEFGLDVSVLDAPIGAASALKLAYAGMTKGFTALAAAMIGAAARENLAGAFRAELARSQPDMLARMERSIPAMFPKAYRWVAEMEEIARFAAEKSEGEAIYQGAANLYDQIATEFQTDTASQWLSALASFCKDRV
jgi:L-threonate 2-dehydrogenase